MKSSFLIALLLICFMPSFGQHNFISFKTTSIWLRGQKDPPNSELLGPVKMDMIVLFDLGNNQIIGIENGDAKIYKIIEKKNEKAANGNPIVNYTTMNNGRLVTIIFLKLVSTDKTDKVDTRVIIDDHDYPITMCDGIITKVFL